MWILEILIEGPLAFVELHGWRRLFKRKQLGKQKPWSKKEWYAQVLYLTLFIAACFLAWYCFLG